MNQDLNELPEWDDSLDEELEEGEEWKPNITKEACKALYEKWGTIMSMLKGGLPAECEEEDIHSSFYQGMMIGDAYEVGAKIRSSEAAGIYVVRMENACIIRRNAQAIQSSMLIFMSEGDMDKEYGLLIRNEIEDFKKLFKVWVETFERDEFTDEWGLFV